MLVDCPICGEADFTRTGLAKHLRLDHEAEPAETRYFETRLATRWPPPERLLDRLFDRLDTNKGYRGNWERLDRWWVEFLAEDNGDPWREIGFDAEGEAIMAGPSRRNYGFWCDTNMTMADLQERDEHLVAVNRQDFEDEWERFFATADDEPTED